MNSLFILDFSFLLPSKRKLEFLVLIFFLVLPNILWSQEMPCDPESPSLSVNNQESSLSLKDNRDGTITDPKTKLMWTQKDSYADLNKCLTYTESVKYVHNLKTGGHNDWKIPTLRELTSIYDEKQENVMAWDNDPEYPLALSSKFSEGAAYWYWTADTGTTPLTEHCAKTLYFVSGIIELRRFELCNNGGVRAVRKIR